MCKFLDYMASPSQTYMKWPLVQFFMPKALFCFRFHKKSGNESNIESTWPRGRGGAHSYFDSVDLAFSSERVTYNE